MDLSGMMPSLKQGVQPVASVGGKAASLMKLYSTPGISDHVPGGFALSLTFFNPWVDQVVATPAWRAAEPKLIGDEAASVCQGLKEIAEKLPLSPQQKEVLDNLKTELRSWPGQLAAVRSSAPEEDGTGASFAGVFETKLGVTPDTLEAAVRGCFASVFDHRVFSYAGAHKPAFAAVVMEMVDSFSAGVAFSANPLNSDLDEMIIDSSWGLGESVVDGSVVADRFVYDKVEKKLVEKTIGSKKQERRLLANGGVEIKPVDEARQAQITLSDEQVTTLAGLVSLVETTYGIPMDTEWAHTEAGELKLLQARPITTIYPLDKDMITKPGERRVLYYDFNIASEATTTSAFSHMDLIVYSQVCALMSGGSKDVELFTWNPKAWMFNSTFRQFVNVSHAMKFYNVGSFASTAELVDFYLASIMRGDDFNRSKYRTKGYTGFTPNNVWFLMRKIPVCTMMNWSKKFKDINKGLEEWKVLDEQRTLALEELMKRGATGGIQKYCDECFEATMAAFEYEMGAVFLVLPHFQTMDGLRKDGKTQQERDDGDAMCGGYEGDPLMQMNVAMYVLARKLPLDVWTAYEDKYEELAVRIAKNLEQPTDLPKDFLDCYADFMKRYGWDGSDQMFISSRRYWDAPEILLAKLRNNVGDGINDPSHLLAGKVEKRREVMRRQEAEAGFMSRSKITKRNEAMEKLCWMRNVPKLSCSKLMAMVHLELLKRGEQLFSAGRLDEKGDVFHCTMAEVDQAAQDPEYDLRAVFASRKARFLQVSKLAVCPLFIDSRCRILKPNVVIGEPGTLVGAAISPGVARGRVRICTSPTEKLQKGEVLCAIVTDPAWTPLFVGASAVVLQIGGALQHGALCAREYGKPAVSNIDVMTDLKTGMLVEVDGNTGVVKIIEEDVVRRASRSLSKIDLE